jgi:hypothetical protein
MTEPVGEARLDDIGLDMLGAGKPSLNAHREQAAFEIEKARQSNSHKIELDGLKLGTIGRFFGSRDNAVIYIVALLVLICVLSVGVIAVAEQTLRSSSLEFFRVLVIALVGFFAGRSSSTKDD